MMKIKSIINLAGAIIFCFNTLSAEELKSVDSLAEAFLEGRSYLSLRYKYEQVHQEGFSKQANSSTLRSRIGIETAKYQEFNALFEVEDVTSLGNDLFNSTVNNQTSYPVVADPSSTEINQALLSYHGLPETLVTGGRKILTLDDSRFIGDVLWRQNVQTYDAVDILNTSLKDTQLYYAWAYQVNRVFGEDSEKGKFYSNSHFLNLKNTLISGIDLTGFAYLLDLTNSDPSSCATYGVRANGKRPLTEDLNLIFDTSYAHQSDYANNPNNYAANYYHINTGLGIKLATLSAGYEVLGSDNGNAAFQTPLATLFKFNGWADQFLSTPVTGLRDFYTSLAINLAEISQSLGGYSFSSIWHDFTADEGSAHYGNELDLILSKTFLKDLAVEIRYANYNAADYSVDTEKFWLVVATKFSA